MSNGQIAQLLEFANMQMAAEAFLSQSVDDIPNRPPQGAIKTRLEVGNTHASKFMSVQAQQFVDTYEVLLQYRNDTLLAGGTGFSGTLFRNRGTGALTLSFRSTEFIDDAVRDGKSTNELEVKGLGWAFGQIAEMEAWYAQLRQDPALLGGQSFNVTGYSLGGHLATAFNILRREEAAATGNANPVIATYTFNGAGTGTILNGRRLTDIISDLDRIRADFAASPEWTSLSQPVRDTYVAAAQSRVDTINAESLRVAGLSGVTRAFAASAPTGSQALLGYQIAALLVSQNTVGASNFPLPGGTNNIPSSPVFAADALRFANMTEVVGMETAGLATSFVSNSGVHYGYRQEIAIEAQPVVRGLFPLLYLLGLNLLVDNPDTNNFADTHSLVLVVDSLSLMAAMEKFAPNLTIETAGQIFAAMSNATASSSIDTQGVAEGDTLERALDAMRKLVLGPQLDPTLNREQMLKVLEGNTWHENAYRAPFLDRLKELRDRITALTALNETFVLDSLVSISAAQLAAIAGSSEAIAYRYALKELNPFAVVGDTANAAIYSWHNLAGELDLYSAADRTGALTAEWITDRSAFLAWKNIANTQNTLTNPSGVTLLQSNLTTESQRFIDLPQRIDLGVVPLGGGMPAVNDARRFVFGGDSTDNVVGGAQSDRLYGGGSTDVLSGKGGNDYLEGGAGLDLYQYGASRNLLGITSNDGADTILDTDGKGVLRYTYTQVFSNTVQSTVIADASVTDGAIWRSADGKFSYEKQGADLVVTILGDAGGSIMLKDWRDGDFGIRLWEARSAPQTTNTINAVDYQDNQTIFDTAANDLILGDARNNGINASSGGSNWIQAGAGRDIAYALTALVSDVHLIEGGAGDDLLAGGAGDDELYADTHVDLAQAITAGGTPGNGLHGDWLSGGWGDDVLVGDLSNDGFSAGRGKDIIVAGGGDDNILGDADWVATTLDWYYVDDTTTNTRVFYWFNGSENYEVGEADIIYGGAGNDYVWSHGGDDLVYGEQGRDSMAGGGGSDVLIGGADDDLLGGDDPRLAPAQHGDDYLDGGAGDDVLLGDGGNDVLIGGPGVDSLYGGAGKDIYVFNRGDGTETVSDTPASANDPEASIVVTGDGISRSDIKFRTGSLLVDFGGGDGIHFQGFDQLNPANSPVIGEIRFADGTSMSYADILTQGFDIDGTEGNDNGQPGQSLQLVGTGVTDRIRGFGGNDVLFGLGGDDVLDGGTADDQLVGGVGADALDGGDSDDFLWGDEDGLAVADQGADVMSGGAGNDYLQGYGGGDLMFGNEGSDTLYGQAGADYMEGGDGDDFLWGDDSIADQSNDTLDGGGGNDQLVAYAGNDTYVFGRGYGQDIVFDQDATVGNVDVVQFAAEISLDDVTATQQAGTYNLSLEIDGTTDVLTIANHFFSPDDKVEEIRFADGTLWTSTTIPTLIQGSSFNDVLNGTAGADVFKSGAGSDVMSGETGNDTYRYYRGDGADYIFDFDATAGNLDKILFAADILPSQVQASRSGSDLRLTLTATDSVAVNNYFQNDGVTPYAVEQIKFMADGTVWDVNMVKSLVLTATAGDDTITGYATDDNLSGGGGNDTLIGNAGNDMLAGGTGNDALQGGTGNDIYVISRGDGQDTITDSDSTAGNIDKVQYAADILPSEVKATRSGNNLVLGLGPTDQVTVINYFDNDGATPYSVEQIQFLADDTNWDVNAVKSMVLTPTAGDDTITGYATDDVLNGLDGNDVIHGAGGADTLDGGAGNDTLFGEGGSDTYLFARGSGQDTLINASLDSAGSTDVLSFAADILPSEITPTRSANDLVLTLQGGADQVRIQNYFLSGQNVVEEIRFADGTVWTQQTIFNLVPIVGTEGNDTLFGSSGSELIRGLGGDDTIYGSGGNDTIEGGTYEDWLYGAIGNDTYLIDLGDVVVGGRDYIGDAGGYDVLQFGAGIIPSDPYYWAWDGFYGGARYLYLAVQGTPGSVYLLNYWGTGHVEEIRFADGTVWTDRTFAWIFPTYGTAGNDYMNGTLIADSMFGFDGDDTVYGGMGHDTLDGGAGADQLIGFVGNDSLVGGAGADTVLGGDGNDKLDGGLGSDTLYGEDGNDTLIAGAGESKNAAVSNFLYGGTGDDVLVSSGKTDFLYGESGNDVLLGGAGRDWLEETGGNNLMSSSSGVDNIWMGSQNDLVIGGAGDDLLDGDRDADGMRGQDILVFNKSDGKDSVTRLGSGSTISIGGGTLYSNLSLEVQGSTLRLKTGTSNYVSLSDWYGNPANNAVTTLQIVIEGTRDYKPTSSNPMLNQKVQVFDFLGLAAAFDAARAAGQTFNVANNLATYRIGGSDTAMIGGAIAYQYARTGNLGTLTYSQMQAVINDPAFGVSAQPIAAPVVTAALDAGTAVDASADAFAAATLAAETTTATGDASRLAADSGTIADQRVQVDSIALETDTPSVEEDATPPLPDFLNLPGAATEHLPILPDRAAPRIPLELLTPPTPIPTSFRSSPPGAQITGTRAAHAFGSTPHSAGAPESRPVPHAPLVDNALTGSGVSDIQGDAVHTSNASTSSADDATPGETDSPIEQWFAPHSLNDDLTLLDEIARGEGMVNAPSQGSVAAAWEASHRWLSQYANARKDTGEAAADGADLSGLSLLGTGSAAYDMPQPVVGLRNVPGHQLTSFHGLREGISVLAQP